MHARPNLEKFPSDLRQRREEIRFNIFTIYVNTLHNKKLFQYEPSLEAFKRAIFLDEKYVWEKGPLKMWIEFTDPTNSVSILSSITVSEHPASVGVFLLSDPTSQPFSKWPAVTYLIA